MFLQLNTVTSYASSLEVNRIFRRRRRSAHRHCRCCAYTMEFLSRPQVSLVFSRFPSSCCNTLAECHIAHTYWRFGLSIFRSKGGGLPFLSYSSLMIIPWLWICLAVPSFLPRSNRLRLDSILSLETTTPRLWSRSWDTLYLWEVKPRRSRCKQLGPLCRHNTLRAFEMQCA